VDFDAMASRAVADADAAWTAFDRLVRRLGPPPDPPDRVYWDHPGIEAFRQNHSHYDTAGLSGSREAFLEQERLNAPLPCWGYVHRRQRFDREGPDPAGFTVDGTALLRRLPADTLLTLVAVHS
jgi:hypothetical protein